MLAHIPNKHCCRPCFHSNHGDKVSVTPFRAQTTVVKIACSMCITDNGKCVCNRQVFVTSTGYKTESYLYQENLPSAKMCWDKFQCKNHIENGKTGFQDLINLVTCDLFCYILSTKLHYLQLPFSDIPVLSDCQNNYCVQDIILASL